MARSKRAGAPEAWPAELAPLAADVERVAGRLRGLTEARLHRPLAGYGTVAGAGRVLAQTLADLAAAAEAAVAAEAGAAGEAAAGEVLGAEAGAAGEAAAAEVLGAEAGAAAEAAAAEVVGGGAPRRRTLPELAVTAVGDQVAVTGHDLLRALAALPPDAELATAEGPRRATDVAAAAHDLTRAVKLAVD